MATTVDEGFLSIDEMRLEYGLFGSSPAQSPSIVMLHEGLGSIRTWGAFPKTLAESTGAGVFVYSREGYGSSPLTQKELPVDYIRRHALQVLPRVLEAIEFSAGLLLGHSDGASMVTAYAGTVIDPRVRGLVLLAPHFCVEEETLAEIRNAREAFTTRGLRSRLSRYHADVDAAFMRWSNVWLDPQFARFDLRPELANVGVPTLIIRGDEDKYGTHRQVRLAEATRRGRLETLLMPACGHVPHRERPAETVEQITRFYRSVLAAAQ